MKRRLTKAEAADLLSKIKGVLDTGTGSGRRNIRNNTKTMAPNAALSDAGTKTASET